MSDRHAKNTPEAAAYWREVAKGRLRWGHLVWIVAAAYFFGVVTGAFFG